MRTECAVLCDAASVREGLLHLLGAGVTEIAVRGFPARLPVTFAFRVVLESREIRESHTLRLELSDSTTGDVEGEVRLSFQRAEGVETPFVEAALVAPVGLGVFEVTRTGLYLVAASLDQTRIATLPLRIHSESAEAVD